jgi:hypothetical protein
MRRSEREPEYEGVGKWLMPVPVNPVDLNSQVNPERLPVLRRECSRSAQACLPRRLVPARR